MCVYDIYAVLLLHFSMHLFSASLVKVHLGKPYIIYLPVESTHIFVNQAKVL